MRLLETVWEVLRVEEVPPLVGFVYLSILLLSWAWELDQILLVDVRPILCILTIIVWRLLDVVVDDWESCTDRAVD